MARVWKFENDIDTDIITPGRMNLTTDINKLGEIAFCEYRPEYSPEQGDFIIAGENFGCGSSRESAAVAIKASGVSAVIAKSFARIFYRNAINIGLQVYTSQQAHDLVEDGQEIELDQIPDLERPAGFLQQVIDMGGIQNYLKEKGRLEIHA